MGGNPKIPCEEFAYISILPPKMEYHANEWSKDNNNNKNQDDTLGDKWVFHEIEWQCQYRFDCIPASLNWNELAFCTSATLTLK